MVSTRPPNLLSDEDRRRIVAGARNLEERFAATPRPASARPDSRAQLRLERWCQVVASGDHEIFSRRLAYDNLDASQVLEVLGTTPEGEAAEGPPWIETLAACLLATELSTDAPDRDTTLEGCEPLPFEDALWGFVGFAAKNLRSSLQKLCIELAAPARRQLERRLLAILSQVAAPTLQLEFSVFRSTSGSALGRALSATGPALQGHYRRFVESLRVGGWRRLVTEYTVLGRLLATAVELWIRSHEELFECLAADRVELARLFADGRELGIVGAVDSPATDHHRGGRSVAIVSFLKGPTVVYKPRCLDIDDDWFELLGWLEAKGFALPFKRLRVLSRAAYGWIEFVHFHLPADPPLQRRYDQRTGALIALLHVLVGTDFHFENLVASGEQPVLVDVETLLQPRLEAEATGRDAQRVAERLLRNSVVRTGMVPRWEMTDDGRGYDLSGIGAMAGEQQLELRVPVFEQINSDRMHLSWRTATRKVAGGATFGGLGAPSGTRIKAVLEGFRAMAHLLIETRAELLAADGPVAAMARRRIRFILRPTRLYSRLLLHSLDPEFMREGIDRSIELELLACSLLAEEDPKRLWPLLGQEIRSLEQLDIPTFDAQPAGDFVRLEDGSVRGGVFPSTSLGRAQQILKHLDDVEIERQVRILEGAFASRLAPSPHATFGTETLTVRESSKPADLEDSSQRNEGMAHLSRAAAAIVQRLARHAIYASDGSVTWIAPQLTPQGDQYQVEPLGPGLYDGLAGVALLLAAHRRMSGTSTADPLLDGVLRAVYGGWQEPASIRGLGLCGLGGGIYAATRLWTLTGDLRCLELARGIAQAITPERLAADRRYDVLDGAAGLVLALLVLYEVGETPSALSIASQAGRHLLAQRKRCPAGLRVWQSTEGPALTGFSHGISGIACALLRLAHISGEAAFREAAEEALAYEHQHYDPALGTWPDLRPHRYGQPAGGSWCNGVAGIGWSRLAALPHLAAPCRIDLERVIVFLEQSAPNELDQLCCGSLGEADFLLVAGRRLRRPELEERAFARALRVIGRASVRRHFATSPKLDFHPGFFQGLSGIGYQLLRMASPTLLPSVLGSE